MPAAIDIAPAKPAIRMTLGRWHLPLEPNPGAPIGKNDRDVSRLRRWPVGTKDGTGAAVWRQYGRGRM